METRENISQKMKNSGHSNRFIKRILMAGITKYERKLRNSKLDKDHFQYKPLHQPSGRSVSRMKKKTLARENWFRSQEKTESDQDGKRSFKEGGNKDKKTNSFKSSKKITASTVMFVPSSRNGILLKRMRENEEKLTDMTGFRVSYSEAGGTQLGRMFSTNLSSGQHCGRMENKCRTCNVQEPRLNCKARSIVYESCCKICNPSNQEEHNSTPTAEK